MIIWAPIKINKPAINVLTTGASILKKIFKIIDMPNAIKKVPSKKSNNMSFITPIKWGEQWVSNPRPPEPQSGALPTELCSPLHELYQEVYVFYLKKQR